VFSKYWAEGAGASSLQSRPLPCDFALSPYVKKRLKGKRFSNDEDLLRAWDDECAQIPEETWKSWFDDWFRRM
jgi:hypothetical protein